MRWSLGRRAGNLPVEVTSFVGRGRELRNVRKTLADARLLTLTGAGGVGKTRLARRLGEELCRVFPGGVWLVDLASAPAGTDVAAAVSDALPDELGSPVAGVPPSRSTLLLLDNCDHLLAECADFIADILHGTTAVRILVTSRQPVGVLGEHVVEIAPLSTPARHSAGHVEASEAVQLFTERASVAVPSFSLDQNTAAVAELCRRLDGIPLAIELAALRLRVLSPRDLLARLDDPHQLLRLSSRAAQPRQRSLHASHRWSYELCSERERLLWTRLSVFAERFDLAAADAVCSGDGIEEGEVLDLLARLVEKSIVSRVADGAGGPYRLMESTRQFGTMILRETGDDERHRMRHAHYFARRAVRLIDDLHADGCAKVADAVGREHGDLTAAIDFLVAHGDRSGATLRLATLLCLCPADMRSYVPARRRLREVVRAAADPTPGKAHALLAYGLGALAAGEDDESASALHGAALLADQLGDQSAQAYATEAAGLRAAAANDLDTACDLLTRAFRSYVERGDEFGIHQSYRHLLVVAWSRRDPRLAARVRGLPSESGLTLRPGWTPYAGVAAGLARLRESSVDEAVRNFGDALAGLRPTGDHRWIALCCDALTQCALSRDHDDRAARLLGFTRMMWESLEVGDSFVGGRLDPHGSGERRLRSRMGGERCALAMNDGAALTLDEVVDLADDERATRRGPADLAVRLTPREVDVAVLVCQGLTNRAIGEALSVSKRTIESHIEHIMTKLGCTRRSLIAATLTTAQKAEHRAGTRPTLSNFGEADRTR